MTHLTRYSEPYAATGSHAAEGVVNQLGRPDMEPLEVLVREAIQNSSDAAPQGGDSIRVRVGHQTLSDEGRRSLLEEVLPDPPEGLGLGDALTRDDLGLLYFADYGTKGLGGPTRANVDDGGPRDFVDFVRNIGQPPDTTHGGGSYGFGKAAFYLVSRAGTVLVDTLTRHENERRFIAYGLGRHYTEGDTPHTGRHWWGVTRDGIPEPVVGDAAAELAGAVGLPPRRPNIDHGTTVAIVAPRLTFSGSDSDWDESPETVMGFIGESLLWNFWPKLIAAPGREPAMRFELLIDDREITVGAPADHPRLAPFVRALDVLRAADPPDASDPFDLRTDEYCLRPRRRVGQLAIHQTATSVVEPAGPQPQAMLQMAFGHHHVALVRAAELIVKYVDGPPMTIPGRGYAGVFKADAELDQVFRRSEPPTHDDWEPAGLNDWTDRRLVGSALRRIQERLTELAGREHRREEASVGETIPLGRLADDLAALMPAVTGTGARRSDPAGTKRGRSPNGSGRNPGAERDGGRGGESGRSRATAGPLTAPELVVSDGGTVEVQARFALETAGAPVQLSGEVEVLTVDGGQVERAPPEGAEIPRVVRWLSPTGREVEGPGARAESDESGEWTVAGSHHPDLMVRLAVDVGHAEAATE